MDKYLIKVMVQDSEESVNKFFKNLIGVNMFKKIKLVVNDNELIADPLTIKKLDTTKKTW